MSRFNSQLPLFALTSLDPDRRGASGRGGEHGERGPQLCVLGSGSGGNCTVVRHGQTGLLIDIGLGPRIVGQRLENANLRLDAIDAICLTHLDQDHFRSSWIPALLRLRINLFIHRGHEEHLLRRPGGIRLKQAGLVHLFEDDRFCPLPNFVVRPMRMAHDRSGTCAFDVAIDQVRIGYATDLGHVPPRLVDHFTGVDLLAMESNYDPDLQRASGRPRFLQRRIMGQAGHLSNRQAFEAISQIVDRSSNGGPRYIVLLHRSGQCNQPELVHKMFAQDPRIANRLILAEQSRCTDWLTVSKEPRSSGTQMELTS